MHKISNSEKLFSLQTSRPELDKPEDSENFPSLLTRFYSSKLQVRVQKVRYY